MARVAVERFGQIDGLINNAAVFQRPAMSRGPIEEIPVEEWDRLMAVNLRGIFLCCRAVVPHMKQRRSGKIINISSGTVFYGAPEILHYVTSKAGVIGFTTAALRQRADSSRETRSINTILQYNIFVTCQTDGDLPWVLKYAGEHSLVIGTDYGHTDPSSELDAISVFSGQEGISQDTKEGILHHNPKTLYNL